MAILGEMHGSPTERQEWNGAFSATRRLRCNWNTRFADIATLLNFPGSVYPGKSGVYATSAGCLPRPGKQKGSGTTASYDEAILTVNYESPSFNAPQNGDDYGHPGLVFSETIEPATEFQTIQSDGLRWASDHMELPPNVPLGRRICDSVYVFTRYMWTPSKLQFDAMEDVRGMVNQNPVTMLLPPYRVFESETLLFADPSYRYELDGAGNHTWTGIFRFEHKKGGWNKYWRKDMAPVPGYDSLETLIGVPVPPYESVAFESIFLI